MSPGSVRGASRTKRSPLTRSTLPSTNLPTRILGPCRSAINATVRPTFSAMVRTMLARSMWSCALPWLKFRRTTSTPARIRRSSTSGSLVAGPRVATILVPRIMTGCLLGARAPLQRSNWITGLWALPDGPGYRRITASPPRRGRSRERRPATRRDGSGRPPLEDLQRRQSLAFEDLEEGAAAGGDVADVLVDAVLGNGGEGVAAAGDRECRAGGDRSRQRL